MSSRLARRLERLEAHLAPDGSEVLKVTVTRVGKPVRVIEVRLPQPDGRRRRRLTHGVR
jgi:hypothetical protein